MRYSEGLPQLTGERLFLTDGGLETSLIFHQGLDLPAFAAFHLLKDEQGVAALRQYFEPYLAIAHDRCAGFVLDTPTWRANPDWGTELGYSPKALEAANRKAVALAEDLRIAEEDEQTPIVIEGVIGPRGDGYQPDRLMSVDEAEAYHLRQIATLADAGVDMVTGVTINYAQEAIGIVCAARAVGVPVAVSFTVETDGRLPTGQSLRESIEQVDAETDAGSAYFMINCAHPSHFAGVLEDDGPWLARIGGVRANASRKSHAELDEAEELDEGDPAELAQNYRALRDRLQAVTVLGGCCGTDHRHVDEISSAWLATA